MKTASFPPPSQSGPLLGYARRQGPLAGLYDELLHPEGQVRPHWQDICAYFEKLGEIEITRRWNHALKILRDNGVAYNTNITAAARSRARPWALNPVPLRIPARDWAVIEPAIRQRARLLNTVLNDLYGGQALLKNGLIPPALVLGNSAYLRPCAGVPVPHEARLVFYAADLARSPNGEWWVVSDSTQAPSGAGYALENRIVLSRVFPEIFHSTRIARLGGFFRQLKQSLEALTPRPGLPANVALLTPGALSETYFEHAYLARQLGFALVEGQDLMVRNGTVFIRTLQGLQRIDVILRRVDDDYCDPLELRDESLLGVPGLMNAVRAGNVTLANSLGSGLVQCPAMAAFLPKLCEHLFQEPLQMPSVATWWCGQPKEQAYVLDNLHGLEAKPAFAFPGERPARGADLQAWKQAIRQRPEYFVGQEIVRLSQCPDFIDGHSMPASVLLRVFAVRSGDDYLVMPGGLTRVAQDESSQGILMRADGGTKDTWVDLADPSPAHAASVGSDSGSALHRSTPVLTSRIADNLFWAGRYTGRCEFTTRLVRAMLDGLLNRQGGMEFSDFQPVSRTLRHFGQYCEPGEASSQEALAYALMSQMLDAGNAGSLASICEHLRGVLTSVRDQVNTDTWRIANQLAELATTIPGDLMDFDLDAVILHLCALNGVLHDNMVHGHGWRFLELGRRIERALYGTRLIAESIAAERPAASTLFDVLLEVFDASISYRQKHTVVRKVTVIDLLLCDESNQRSLASQLAGILDSLLALPRDADNGFKLPEERLALRMLSDTRLLDVRELRPERLEQLETEILQLSELITRRFFVHLHTASLGRDVAISALPDTV